MALIRVPQRKLTVCGAARLLNLGGRSVDNEAAWRFEFARDLVGALPRHPGLCAAFVGVSVARGYSDPYSDIELLLFWRRDPDSATRQAIVETWRAERRLPVDHPSHDSAFVVRGVPIDVWQRTVADEEAILDRVLRDHSRDLTANAELDMVNTALPLRGEAVVRGWQARAADYPEALALGFLREQLPHFHLRQLGLAAVRDNPTAFHHTLSDLHCTLFLVLLALNGAYFPTFKWLYRRLDELAVAPPEAAARLRRMFREPPIVAAAQLRIVFLETLALVEEHCPRLDAGALASARHGVAQGEAVRVVRP